MLKYLFKATYWDGTEYYQNPDDVSIRAEDRSCFYDVEQAAVARFEIFGEGHAYVVDLADGHFEVDGVPFFMHEDGAVQLSDFRLVFFRRHTHTFDAARNEVGHDIVWRIGWQANKPDGENIQRVMEVR